MDIIVSHQSALEYWRKHGDLKIAGLGGQRRKSLPVSIPKSAVIRDGAPAGLSCPICLMVGGRGYRKSNTVWTRMYNGPIPNWSFVEIGDGLTVCAPPLCFFQMAGELPLIKLIELGFELCGSYSLATGLGQAQAPADEPETAPKSALADVDRNIYGHARMTSVKALKAYIAHMEGVSGYKNASRALQYIVDGSASPMETILVMFLTLPHMLGGYGLPAPELNWRIDTGSVGKRGLSKPYYVCDLFWPQANLAVEYDSDFYHTGADRIASDSTRRNALSALGIFPLTVTSRQLQNANEFANVAEQIAKRLGKRLRYDGRQFSIARRELRKVLLPYIN